MGFRNDEEYIRAKLKRKLNEELRYLEEKRKIEEDLENWLRQLRDEAYVEYR